MSPTHANKRGCWLPSPSCRPASLRRSSMAPRLRCRGPQSPQARGGRRTWRSIFLRETPCRAAKPKSSRGTFAPVSGWSIYGKFREASMERRAFLKLLCIGTGVVAAAAPAEAFTSFVPLAAPDHDLDLAPQPGVATSKDMERAQVEKAWYGH